MSFDDKATFSMIATREKQHASRVATFKNYDTRLLPVAAIYGGNASGKSNLWKALYFAKRFVVNGQTSANPLLVEPFRLNSGGGKEPSSFCFELAIGEAIYEFSFAVTQSDVVEEKLVEVTPSSENIIYHRRGTKELHLGTQFRSEMKEHLKFAFHGTDPDQLFLTNATRQKIDAFRPIYDWFEKTLTVIGPTSHFEPFEILGNRKGALYKKMSTMLAHLDTGIEYLDQENVPWENVIPEAIQKKILANLAKGPVARVESRSGERLALSMVNGKLLAKKLVSCHLAQDGAVVRFDLSDESDGSRRLIDLVPAFIALCEPSVGKVFVIDELDRSLHTLLTRRLLEAYLSVCSADTRSQLIFTTHDVLLMDQKLLRRDEMWVTERSNSGSSRLIAFSDYRDVRKDKDIRKSYLQGRLGGIPRLSSIEVADSCKKVGKG